MLMCERVPSVRRRIIILTVVALMIGLLWSPRVVFGFECDNCGESCGPGETYECRDFDGNDVCPSGGQFTFCQDCPVSSIAVVRGEQC